MICHLSTYINSNSVRSVILCRIILKKTLACGLPSVPDKVIYLIYHMVIWHIGLHQLRIKGPMQFKYNAFVFTQSQYFFLYNNSNLTPYYRPHQNWGPLIVTSGGDHKRPSSDKPPSPRATSSGGHWNWSTFGLPLKLSEVFNMRQVYHLNNQNSIHFQVQKIVLKISFSFIWKFRHVFWFFHFTVSLFITHSFQY